MSKKLKKGLKKSVSVVTAITTIVWLSGLALVLTPAVSVVADERPSVTVEGVTIYDGDLISSNATNPDGTPTYESLDIYIAKVVGAEKYKRLILNAQVFDSYGHLNWSDVKEVDQSVMDAFTTSCLIREDGDTKVYALAPDDDTGTKSWINLTAEEFLGATPGAYSTNDSDAIYTVNSTDAGNYTTTGDITTVAALEAYLADGTLPGVTGGLTVALSSTTPASATVPSNATGVVFTKFDVSASSEGDVVINGLTVKRTGVGAYSDLSKVYIYEGNTRLTSGRTINSSTNEAIFTNMNYTVPAGTTKTLSIVADIGNNKSGIHALGIASADAISTTATVSGTFPVAGNSMSLSSTTAGKVDVESTGSAYSRKVGETGVEVANFTVYVDNTEDAHFSGITLYNSARDILDNLKLYRGSDLVAEATKSGDYFVFSLDTPYAIAKGDSVSFIVKGDVSGRADDTATLYVRYNTDVKVTGDSYGFNLGINASIGGSGNSYIEESDSSPLSNTTTAQAGQLTLALNGPIAGDVSKNTNDVVLMNFSATPQSTVEISKATITISGNANLAADDVDDLELVCGDAVVASWSTVTIGDNSSTDVWTLTGGETTECQVRIDITNSADGDETIKATLKDLTSSSNWTIRDASTGDTVSDIIPSSDIAGNTMNVTAASLTVNVASVPAAGTTYVTGAEDASMVGFVFTAGAAADVKVNTIKLTAYLDDDRDGFGDTNDMNQLSNAEDVMVAVKIYDDSTNTQLGTTKSLTVGSSDVTATFDTLNWTIPAGTDKKLLVKADISTSGPKSGDADYAALAIAGVGDISAEYGSGTTLGVTLSGGNTTPTIYQTIAVSGSLAVALSVDTPTTHIVTAGSTLQDFSIFKLTATSEDIQVKKIRLIRDADGTGSDADISKVYLYVDGSEVGKGDLVSGGVDITFTPGNEIVIPKDDSKLLYVKTDLNSTSGGATAGDDNKMSLAYNVQTGNWSSSYANKYNIEAIGGASGVNVYVSAGANLDGNTQYFYATKLDVEVASDTPTTLSSGQDRPIVKFTLSNTDTVNNKDAEVRQLKVDITETFTTNPSDFKLYDTTDTATTVSGTYAGGVVTFDTSSFSKRYVSDGGTRTWVVTADITDDGNTSTTETIQATVDMGSSGSAGDVSWRDGVVASNITWIDNNKATIYGNNLEVR